MQAQVPKIWVRLGTWRNRTRDNRGGPTDTHNVHREDTESVLLFLLPDVLPFATPFYPLRLSLSLSFCKGRYIREEVLYVFEPLLCIIRCGSLTIKTDLLSQTNDFFFFSFYERTYVHINTLIHLLYLLYNYGLGLDSEVSIRLIL